MASVYVLHNMFSCSLDGHQGRNAADYVCSHLFSSLADKLFQNPDDIPSEVKEVFQSVDSTYCKEKAEAMSRLLRKKRNPCCFTKVEEEPYKVHSDSSLHRRTTTLAAGAFSLSCASTTTSSFLRDSAIAELCSASAVWRSTISCVTSPRTRPKSNESWQLLEMMIISRRRVAR